MGVTFIAQASPSTDNGPIRCVFIKSQDTTSIPTAVGPITTKIKMVLSEGLVQEVMEQTFVNPTADSIQMSYVFPLPEMGSVHAMSYTIKKKIVEAKIYRKEDAVKKFDSLTQLGKQAALLTQQKPNVFTQQFSNLGPNDTVKIKIEVSHPLKYVDGTYELAFPTMIGSRFPSLESDYVQGTLGGWNPPADRDAGTLEIKAIIQGQKINSISSPTHQIQIDDVNELNHEGLIDLSTSSFGLHKKIELSKISSSLPIYGFFSL